MFYYFINRNNTTNRQYNSKNKHNNIKYISISTIINKMHNITNGEKQKHNYVIYNK